jgi:hypothetical protein
VRHHGKPKPGQSIPGGAALYLICIG